MIKRIIFFVLAAALASGFVYLSMLAPVITGYAAKNLSSGIFVAGRTQESLEKEDLNFSFIKYTKNHVDYDKKEVTSRFLIWKSKAIYIEGFGCTLVRDFSEKEIRERNYAKVPIPLVKTDTIPWPAGDLIADTVPNGVDMAKLNQAVSLAIDDSIHFKGTFAVTVVYKNQLVAEKYRSDFTPQNRFLSWSMAKSVTNALAGILVKENKLDIYSPARVDDWRDKPHGKITVHNQLQMNSGLEWNEDYGNLSDVTVMLHKVGDMAKFSTAKPIVANPDSIWLYSSGTSNIVSSIIRQTFENDADYYAFPRKALFNKIGMHSAIFETDASGTFVGSSYMYATMRDYARFGLLYLNNGNWLGEQILPSDWVRYTTTPARGSNNQYGAFFWLNKGGDYNGVPADMFSCRGHDGQYIYIIPSKNLVVVRTGFSKKGEFDYYAFLKNIVDAVS